MDVDRNGNWYFEKPLQQIQGFLNLSLTVKRAVFTVWRRISPCLKSMAAHLEKNCRRSGSLSAVGNRGLDGAIPGTDSKRGYTKTVVKQKKAKKNGAGWM